MNSHGSPLTIRCVHVCPAAGRNHYSLLTDKNEVDRKKKTRKCEGCEVQTKRGGGEKRILWQRSREKQKTKQATEGGGGGGGGNHLTPLVSRGQSRCKLDIKTQIAFRRVSPCQKILDTCREQTTIPISSRENIFIFRFDIEWKLWGIRFYGVWGGRLLQLCYKETASYCLYSGFCFL